MRERDWEGRRSRWWSEVTVFLGLFKHDMHGCCSVPRGGFSSACLRRGWTRMGDELPRPSCLVRFALVSLPLSTSAQTRSAFSCTDPLQAARRPLHPHSTPPNAPSSSPRCPQLVPGLCALLLPFFLQRGFRERERAKASRDRASEREREVQVCGRAD